MTFHRQSTTSSKCILRTSKNLSDIVLGGYYPIKMGECFNHQYTVVYKLGFGVYSTIWTARNKKTKEYVTIKVTVANNDSANSKEK